MEDIQCSVFGKGLCNPLNQFFSVALRPLLFTFRFFWVHRFILASLISICMPHAEYLQNHTMICEYHPTDHSSKDFRILFTSKI